MAENECDYDHNVTRRLKDAGFVIVGTTTLPEYGILPVSEARIFGPTRNPWDLARTPGGSSGGAAAAVASGMLPVAHGNDGGGSIRIPAACCGLVGLKPARGRISAAPELGDSSLGIDGMLTRTVADTAAILDVLAGYEPGDATWAPPPAEPFAALAEREPGRLRIAVDDAAADPRRASSTRSAPQAVADAAELLRSLGHEVEEVEPPWQADGLLGAVRRCVLQPHRALDRLLGHRRRPRADGRGHGADELGDLLDDPASSSAIEGIGAAVRLQAFARRLVAFLEPYDALLTPALAERPLPLGTLDTAAPEPMSTFTRSGLFTPFTPVFNATGQPAISLPLFDGRGRPAAGGAARRAPGRRGRAAGARRAAGSGPAVGRARRSRRSPTERLERSPALAAPPPSAAA